MLTLLSLVVALSILVFVHELGHYLAAKRSNVVVEEFGFGYPPRLFAFWRGYGRIIIDGKEIVIPRRFNVPRSLGHNSLVRYGTTRDDKARLVLTRIEEVDAEDPTAVSASRVQSLERGTIYSVNAIPFGGFTKMLGEEDPSAPGSLASKSKLSRIFVLAAGSLMNLLTAVLFFSLAVGLGMPQVLEPENAVVQAVVLGSPAEAAGLQTDDLILWADDREILSISDLQEHTQTHLGQTVVLSLERDGQMIEVEVVPRPEPPEGEGPMGIVLSPRMGIQHFKWYEAIWTGVKQTALVVGLTFTVPVQLIRGLIPVELARPIGPVGIGQLVGDAVQYSLDSGWWFPVMQTMGLLSVALALTNLLPLPGLDGGRILFVIVEGVRGRRVDPAKEGLVHVLGMLLLVLLMLFITWQDIVNPVDLSGLF
jgi:regulator of sigma E protease